MSYAEHMQKEIKKIGTHNKGRGAVGWTRPSGYVTNTEFAAKNDGFKAACEKAGIPADHIEDCGLCTYCHDDLFYSYRKSGGKTGRHMAVMALV